MTALSADTARDSRELGSKKRYLAGTDIFYKGAAVMIGNDGYAYPAYAAANNMGCVGVCTTQLDNSGGSTAYVEVQEGVFKFTGASMGNVPDNVGAYAYATDDDTLSTGATNEPPIGEIVEVVSATEVWVDVNRAKIIGLTLPTDLP